MSTNFNEDAIFKCKMDDSVFKQMFCNTSQYSVKMSELKDTINKVMSQEDLVRRGFGEIRQSKPENPPRNIHYKNIDTSDLAVPRWTLNTGSRSNAIIGDQEDGVINKADEPKTEYLINSVVKMSGNVKLIIEFFSAIGRANMMDRSQYIGEIIASSMIWDYFDDDEHDDYDCDEEPPYRFSDLTEDVHRRFNLTKISEDGIRSFCETFNEKLSSVHNVDYIMEKVNDKLNEEIV